LHINAFVRYAHTHRATFTGETAVTAIVGQFLDRKAQSGTVTCGGRFCVDIIDGTVHTKTVNNETNFGAVTKTGYVSHLELLFALYAYIIAKGRIMDKKNPADSRVFKR
jgi:hypothetical protein